MRRRLPTSVFYHRICGLKVFVSDQRSQFSSYGLQDFLKAHNLQASMSRRGNCHDNAVAESFF
jgi:transposase InsO family protein